MTTGDATTTPDVGAGEIGGCERRHEREELGVIPPASSRTLVSPSATETVPPSSLHPGVTRVRDADGFIGTVLYVGPVASAKNPNEIYAGIVWDDETRGKHDGSVICRRTNALVRHFSCGPTAGSFLRLSKLDVGLDLDERLLRSKYVGRDAPIVAPNNILPHVARTVRGMDKPIEFLGELEVRDRQQLDDLDEVSLRGLGVARATADAESLREFRHMREMDLAGNLLSDWDTAVTILRQFPELVDVSFASNRIRDIPPSLQLKPGEFEKIRVLNLNTCSIRSFATIQIVADVMPNLEELCVAHSDLSDLSSFDTPPTNEPRDTNGTLLPPSVTGFDQLTLLDLSDCKLTSWHLQIRKFRYLPRLNSLVLNDNPITSIYTPDTAKEEGAEEFKSVISLQLSGASISSWSSLDPLSSFASLKSLRFRNNPVTSAMGVGEARAIVIARILQIESLNASPISEKERMEAERRYVSGVARELLLLSSEMGSKGEGSGPLSSDDAGSDAKPSKREELLKSHPRFQELMDRHRDAMMGAAGGFGSGMIGGTAAGGRSIADNAVNVTIRSMAASSCSMEPLRKRLPGSLKVGRLKALCSRAFGLEMELQTLHFRVEDDPFPTELDDDENTLSYYGVNDGAEILMNEIDLGAQRRENALRAEEHSRRVVEQERTAKALQDLQRREMGAHAVAAGEVAKK